ncbi:MAG: coproporphyrinogen dehydrogenase HemZ [Tissierellia bacterium]|nr:coproporphyrinogen dehydrogenase HemZ [Tissierellia bacterium]
MKIQIEKEKDRKEIYDILHLFYPKEELHFVEENGDLKIGPLIQWKDKFYSYNDKEERKRILYEIFQKERGITPPWGILTGVRPVKLVHQWAKTKSKEEIALDLRKKKRLSPDRIHEIIKIYELQRKALGDIGSQYSIYLHIPFCPSRCSYCSFPTIIGNRVGKYEKEYVDHLIDEMRTLLPKLKEEKLRSIYIGGGTPSLLNKEHLEKILLELQNYIDDDVQEFTVEAGREDSLDREKLDLFQQYGVNRICLNPQTMNQKTLHKIGRDQDMNHLKELVKESKKRGFIVNMDIIAGLPGETLKDMERTLREMESLNPEQITVHTLSLKKGSSMEGKSRDMKKEIQQVGEILTYTKEYLSQRGYKAYYLYRQKDILGNFENIGYGKEGHYSIYNMIMTDELESIVALGMGANTKLIGKEHLQWTNDRNIRDYLQDDFKEKEEQLRRFYRGESQ